MKKDLISLVVPCYNEEESLPFFLEKFLEVAQSMSARVDFELIFVNDGSQDATLDILRLLASKDLRVKYISFSRNFGKEAAMLAGLEHAKGTYVAIVDADLQDPLDLLVEMHDTIRTQRYDCVAARRISRDGEPPIRTFFSHAFYALINSISDVKIVSGARDFRLMTARMREAILELQEYNRFSKGIFGFVGFETKWLSYENRERVAGATTWSFYGLLKYSLQGIFSFSTTPLHLVSGLGLLTCVLACAFIIYTVIKTLVWGEPVTGYPTLICVVTFLSGIQLFCMGILGKYLSMIFSEVKKRPSYIIQEHNMVSCIGIKQKHRVSPRPCTENILVRKAKARQLKKPVKKGHLRRSFGSTKK